MKDEFEISNSVKLRKDFVDKLIEKKGNHYALGYFTMVWIHTGVRDENLGLTDEQHKWLNEWKQNDS